MSMFLDCEFDGHEGRLISMAIVADDGDEFYEVAYDAMIDDTKIWIKENVWPYLGKTPANLPHIMHDSLHNFLRKHVGETIIADSPADFIYLLQLCHEMEDDKYRYINLDLDMRFCISGNYTSKIPHNALEDARALRDWYNENITRYPPFGRERKGA